MKNRLLEKTRQAVRRKEKLFCAFLTLGFPDLKSTGKLILEFEKAGVDIIELGFPFSDPMADGPTIQFSSDYALRRGVQMRDAFQVVKHVRALGCKIPILFFSYLNPIFNHGYKLFAKESAAAGLDGLIVPDAPPEEEKELSKACHQKSLARVFLIAPTTEKKRAAWIARRSEGFVYYVSLRGVTGARRQVPQDLRKNLNSIKRVTHKPVLIGFGVSSPGQSRQLGALAQGVIVGSALVEKLRQSPRNIEPAVRFIRSMVRALKS